MIQALDKTQNWAGLAGAARWERRGRYSGRSVLGPGVHGLLRKTAKGQLDSVRSCGVCDLRVLEETVYRKKQG